MGWAARIAVAPGLMIPAFSVAIVATSSPRYSTWSSPIGVTTAISASITLVASHSPPMPTSTTATSTGASAKIAYASATITSKNDSRMSILAVDQFEERRDLLVSLDERPVIDVLAVQHDALVDGR